MDQCQKARGCRDSPRPAHRGSVEPATCLTQQTPATPGWFSVTLFIRSLNMSPDAYRTYPLTGATKKPIKPHGQGSRPGNRRAPHLADGWGAEEPTPCCVATMQQQQQGLPTEGAGKCLW